MKVFNLFILILYLWVPVNSDESTTPAYNSCGKDKFPSEYGCAYYSTLCYGVTINIRCRDNWHFSIRYKDCVPKGMASCIEVTTVDYSTTVDTITTDTTTESEEYFTETVTETTTEATIYTVTDTPRTTVPEPDSANLCGDRHGDLIPDSESCYRFYQCVWGKAELMHCPANLHFDNVLKVCNWPSEAGCESPSGTAAPPMTTAAPVSSDLCAPDKHGDLLADPKSCSNFYQCVWGKAELMHCPINLHFDNVLKVCNWASEAGCENSSGTAAPPLTTVAPGSSDLCAPDKHGDLLPDPKSCSNFYQCVWGKAELMHCPINLHFDNVLKVCNWASEAGCENSSGTAAPPLTTVAPGSSDLCAPNKHGDLLPDPKSCSNFYKCVWGKAELMHCPINLHFDNVLKVCNWASEAGCENSSGTAAPPLTTVAPGSSDLCAPNKHGDLLPDPKSCSNFYQCVWGKAVLMHCPANLHFDNVLKVCNWPKCAGCLKDPAQRPLH